MEKAQQHPAVTPAGIVRPLILRQAQDEGGAVSLLACRQTPPSYLMLSLSKHEVAGSGGVVSFDRS
jgi:hypothetical protein